MYGSDRVLNDVEFTTATYGRLSAKNDQAIEILKMINSLEMPGYVGEDAKSYFDNLHTACNNLISSLHNFNSGLSAAGIADGERILASEEDLVSLAKRDAQDL